MITKIPEIAVILSVIVLGLRLWGDGNRTWGYLLVGAGVIASIWWIYVHSGKTQRVRKKVGKFRVELTWACASVLVAFVIYSSVPKPKAIQEAEQSVVIPAPRVNAATRAAIAATRQESTAVPAAPKIQTHESPESAGALALPESSSGDKGTLAAVSNPSANTGDNATSGAIRSAVTLTYSQNGDTVTVKPSGRVDSTSLAFFFDADVSLTSHSLGACTRCGNGRLKDSTGVPDNKTIWIFWASPPFGPDSPFSITFSSASEAKLLKVIWGPRLPVDPGSRLP